MQRGVRAQRLHLRIVRVFADKDEVLDAAGVPTLLLVGTVVAAAGAVLVWVGADRR